MNKGFHLLEVSLALAIALAAGTWGLRTMSHLVEVYRLYAAGCSIVSLAATARSLAISRGMAVEVPTDPPSRRIGLKRSGSEIIRWCPLPPGVQFVSVPTRHLTFRSRGTAAPAGTLVLENRSGIVRVVVAVSGRVRWELE